MRAGWATPGGAGVRRFPRRANRRPDTLACALAAAATAPPRAVFAASRYGLSRRTEGGQSQGRPEALYSASMRSM